MAAYELTKKSGFYEKNPGTDVSVQQMIVKTTDKSRGIRLGNFVQIRDIIDEDLRTGRHDVGAVYFLRSPEFGKALGRRRQSLSRDGTENPLFRHDETVPFVEQVIAANLGWRQIDGYEVGAGAQTASITAPRLREIQRAYRRDHPVRPHEPQRRHAVQCDVDVRGRRLG